MVFLIFVYSIVILFSIYSVGDVFNKKMNLNFSGFELIIGYLVIFSIFHILSLTPVLLNLNYKFLYYIFYLISLLIIFCIIRTPKTIKINYFLIIITAIFIGFYSLFDFILPGDSSFYLSLIRTVTNTTNLYTFEPWTGNMGNIGFMYYFVTYEVFIGMLAKIFSMDSTIFSVNVMAIVNLVIIFFTAYNFFFKIVKNKFLTNKIFLLYLFIFIFLNSNSHNVLFTHNAFNIMTNIYAGKTIYLNAFVVFVMYLINRIVVEKKQIDIIMLGILNLVTPGLSASALFLQLIITTVVFIYLFVYEHLDNMRFYGRFILITFIPLILNYQLIIFAPDFYLKEIFFRISIEILFLLIMLIGLFLYYFGNKIVNINQLIIKKFFYLNLIFIGIISSVIGIMILIEKTTGIKNAITLLPNLKESIYLFGYNLLLFLILCVLAFKSVYKMFPLYRFLFYTYILLIFLLFLNPYNFAIVVTFITSYNTYHRILYLIPLHFMITLYLGYCKNKFALLIWLFLILIPFVSIFTGIDALNDNINPYYKVKKDIVEVGKKLDRQYTIMAEIDFINELPMVTNNYQFIFTASNIRQYYYNTYNNQEILDFFLLVNEKKEMDVIYFHSLVNKYNVDLIIVYQFSLVNTYLQELYSINYELSTDKVTVYNCG